MEFLKANAGKLGLVVVVLAIAVAVHALSDRGTPSRPAKIQFVCVATGKTFWLERDRARILPLASPDTHERTLLPCYRDDKGSLRVSSRCGSLVRQLEQDAINRLVDPDTLTVRASP
jgi:hypothetical protein